ncbi:MAG: SAM-dependent methyltransferase, partial [Actinomycetota bacterium]|nr:SAM-dependent methyltransferase [Actinomycetota bacterium]
AEHHRTMGDWVRAIVSAGLRLDDVVEPTWPGGLERTWGQWSPLRGRLMPGTAIFVATVPS